MDNLTHSLTGLALARAGLGRLTPHGTLLMILAANAPDSDIVMVFGGTLRYFENHRGYSHCLLAMPVMAMLAVLVTAAVHRERLPWLGAFLAACVGVGSHLLLDWTNSYGIRLLLPFSSRWLFADLNSLTDYFMLLLLVLAAFWPAFAGLVGGEIGSRRIQTGRGSAIAVLVAYLLFDSGRAVLHAKAISRLMGQSYAGENALAAAALPSGGNPAAWTGVVQTGSATHLLAMNLLQDSDLGRRAFYYLPRSSALEVAAETEPFRYFRYFARFPVWDEQPVTVRGVKCTRVELADLRFGTPGAGSFHCLALMDEHNRLLWSRFSYGPHPGDEPTDGK